MKFCCIADEDTARGFGLAGITVYVASTAEQAQASINDVMGRGDCGIIIVTERVAVWVRAQIENIRLKQEGPLIVEIPGPEGPLEGRKTLRDFVEEAVGVRLD